MKENAEQQHPVASGVEALIERLRDEGIAAGQAEAEQRLAQARNEARATLADAEAEAKAIVARATAEAERIRRGGEEALLIAMRDIVLKLKARLADTVGSRVQQLIAHELDQEDFVRQLILQVAGKARRDFGLDEQTGLKVQLPEKLIGLEELRRHPLELHEGSLSHFILSVAADALREGIEFVPGTERGMILRLEGQDIQIDLTEERLSDILLEHLQPRFRAILEGMVK